MDNEIDRKIDVTAILFLLVQNRQQTHDWTQIRSGAKGLANGLGMQEWTFKKIHKRLTTGCLDTCSESKSLEIKWIKPAA